MANKLRSGKLRAEFSRHGPTPTATETKLKQAKRLELEEKQSDHVSVGKKRQRESRVDEDGLNRIKKFKSIEDLQELNVRQLREQALFRGISSSGSRTELINRIYADQSVKEPKLIADSNEEKEEDETRETSVEEQPTSKKGNAVPDQYLPDQIQTNYHVLEQGDNIYDATLNQTNVGDNNNKFYIIQALESNDGVKFMVYTRWGRVGIKGQDKLQGPYTSRESAIQEFEAKFFSKTKNHWSNRNEFVPYPKCYVLLEIDYEIEKESDVQEKPTIENHLLQTTKLDPRIANFISLICNADMMKQRMKELGFNIEKLPLGKLNRSTILKGYDALRRISDIIGGSDRGKLEELSGEFYTIIPHDFGFKKMRDFIIDTHYKLKCKLDMVESLGEIEVATSLFKKEIYSQEDPLYSHYQCLRCELVPLEVDSTEFSMIDKYIHNTGDETRFKIKSITLFKASREGENERFRKFSDIKNRMLLWHGSRLTNWTGILSQGLRIAPPEAPSTGYNFGKGLYFADMFAKSVPYCGANWVNSDAVLVLCEVALGDMHEIQACNYKAHHLSKGMLSSKAIGKIVPNPSQAEVLEDGLVVPLGKPIEQTEVQAVCGRNEYVIFNEDQIRIRYVVHAKLCYNGVN